MVLLSCFVFDYVLFPCLFLTVLWVGLHYVNVAFPGQTDYCTNKIKLKLIHIYKK